MRLCVCVCVCMYVGYSDSMRIVGGEVLAEIQFQLSHASQLWTTHSYPDRRWFLRHGGQNNKQKGNVGIQAERWHTGGRLSLLSEVLLPTLIEKVLTVR